MGITKGEIRRTLSPLRSILQGSFICILDFKINQFDLVNDFIGMLMITWGVFEISKIVIHSRYAIAMFFLKAVSVLLCFKAFYEHFSPPIPPYIASISSFLGISATIGFCLLMHSLCLDANLRASAKSWKITALLFAIIYLIPLVVAHSVAVSGNLAVDAGNLWVNYPIGLSILLMFAIATIPMIYLSMSITKIKNESQIPLTR